MSDLPRTLIVLPRLDAGGAERLNLEAAARLRTLGWDCALFVVQDGGALRPEADRLGVPVIVGSRAASRGSALLPAALRLFAVARRYDLLVAGYELGAVLAAGPVALLWGKPLVAEFHAEPSRVLPQLGRGWQFVMRVAMRLIHPRLAGALAVSDEIRADLSRFFVRSEQVTVVPTAVDVVRVRELAQSPSPVSSGSPLVLAVGRLSPQKDFALLIEAHRRALAAGECHRLVILGEGQERLRLERLIDELELQDSVQLPGVVANPYSWMANAAVLCLSSRYEGMPLVVLEALALGCPVIATDCGVGVRVALADSNYGELVPTGDAQALGQALTRHLHDPAELRRRATAAAPAIAREHSLDRFAERLAALLAATVR